MASKSFKKRFKSASPKRGKKFKGKIKMIEFKNWNQTTESDMVIAVIGRNRNQIANEFIKLEKKGI